MLLERLLPDHRYRLVGRKIVAVIFKDEKIEDGNQSVGGIARGEINLMIFQRWCEQTQIHDAGRCRKVKAVGRSQSRVSVRTLHELVAKTGSPLDCVRGRLR